MVSIPQELVNEIIGYLSFGPRKSLSNYSLVARSWVYPCQKRLFRSVRIPPWKLQTWVGGCLSKSDAPLSYVRHLACGSEDLLFTGRSPNRAGYSLCSLRPTHFNLRNTRILLPPQQIELIAGFEPTLSHVTLSRCRISKSALVGFLNFFPKLEYLCLSTGFSFLDPNGLPPPIDRSSLKELSIEGGAEFPPRVFADLLSLGLRFDALVLRPSQARFSQTRFINNIMTAFGERVRRLKLPRIDGGTHLTLKFCRGLCELELEGMEVSIISSITSMNIEKITIGSSGIFLHPPGGLFWKRLDDILTKLVRRPRYKIQLEVHFRGLHDRGGTMVDLEGLLPSFVTRGRMVVWNPRGKIIYRSWAPVAKG